MIDISSSFCVSNDDLGQDLALELVFVVGQELLLLHQRLLQLGDLVRLRLDLVGQHLDLQLEAVLFVLQLSAFLVLFARLEAHAGID
jgi:hypothetical protein